MSKDAPPRLVLGEDRAVAVGDFTALEAGTPDKRYTLFGNLGLVLENPPHGAALRVSARAGR